MADEQSQEPGTLDDAYRQADEQLRRKIEELRAMASGTLQPVEGQGETPAQAPVATAPPQEEQAGNDAHLQPTEAYAQEEAPVYPPATATATETPQDVPELTQVPAQPEPVQPAQEQPVAAPVASEQQPDQQWNDAQMRVTEVPEPVHGGFIPDPGQEGVQAPAAETEAVEEPTPQVLGEPRPWLHAVAESTPGFVEEAPSYEQTEFWAQTRGAIEELQQTTEALRSDLPIEISRLVSEAKSKGSTSALPDDVVERIERLRQLNEKVPTRLDKLDRNVQSLREETGQVDRAVASSIERIERTVRNQFEQIERQMRDRLENVESAVRDELEEPVEQVHKLSEQMTALRETVVEHGAAETIEQLGTDVRRLGEAGERSSEQTQRAIEEARAALDATRDEVRASTEEVQRQADRLEAEISGTVRTEVASARRSIRELVDLDLGSTVGEIASLGRETAERLATVAEGLESDRLQHAKDLEMLVDTMATGWQGLYRAVNKLLDRVDDFDVRVGGVERQLNGLSDLEQNVTGALEGVQSQLDQHLESVRQHLAELQPAPVMVSVNHPDAQLETTTRSGYTRQTGGSGKAKKDSRRRPS